MESLSNHSERLPVSTDVSEKNRQLLKFIMDLDPATIDEHIRRAVAFYHIAMEEFDQDALLWAETDDGPHWIRLIDQHDATEPRAPLEVTVDQRTSQALEQIHVGGRTIDGRIMDDVIAHYVTLMEHFMLGNKVWVKSRTGEKINELVPLRPR